MLFAASTALTVVWCGSMSAMGGMQMPGGWTMSMTWMRMPGQTWPGAAASFLGMWVVMMVAMMLPSLVPMLWRYRQAVRGTDGAHTTDGMRIPPASFHVRKSDRGIGIATRHESRLGLLTTVVGAGYFFVWTVVGMAVFPLGVVLAAIEMQQPALSRAVPILAGVAVFIGGGLQFTAWKTRQLARCRDVPGDGRALPADAITAWRHGLRIGLHCARCCANLMVILMVIGVMDLRAMAAVTVAITIERLVPGGARVA